MRNLLHNVGKYPASRFARWPRILGIALIRIYQNTFSPDHGPLRHLHPYGYCRHSPTCSMYAIEQLEQRGLLLGSFLSMKRLLSCHPWKKPDERRVQEAMEKL